MSLRAIKKRDNQLNNTLNSGASANFNARPPQTLFRPEKRRFGSASKNKFVKTNPESASCSLTQQYQQLGRRATHSNPELLCGAPPVERFSKSRLFRSKSESDLGSYAANDNSPRRGALLNAKSEISLQRISSHTYQQKEENQRNMLSGARSHRDLTQSAYAGSSSSSCPNGAPHTMTASASSVQRQRRRSDCSLTTTSSSAVGAMGDGFSSPQRVPIIGYEVMEERARFTVYKLRVENPCNNDCWLVLRRYTDFVRLNTKLKQSFPHIVLTLPRKKIFGDNFNSVFLDNRVQGLQAFVNAVMAREELRQCKLVREFFCLDEPPSEYSESMEECRAIFEAQEETIAQLKLQISNKNDLILNLQQKLRDELLEKDELKQAIETMSCSRCSAAIDAENLN